MKKKISRLLGVGLTIALLASLMVAVAPASAATLSWGAEKDPTDLLDNVIVPGISITDVAANGDIIYAATDNSDLPLYKSTDAGATWTSLASTTSFPTGVSVKAVAVAPDDADYVAIITSANEVEYSSTGGSSWTDLNKPSDTSPAVTAATISAIDIAPGSTRYLAVGGNTTGSAAELFTIKLTMAETWQARMSGASGITPLQTNVKAVRFSPGWATEKGVAVISGNASSSTFQLFRYELGDYDWNGSIDYLSASDWGTGLVLTPTTAISGSLAAADIALPASYLANDEGERLAYIGVAGVTTGGGVIRIVDTVQKDFDTWSGGFPGAIGTVAYHESGKIVVGSYTDNRVYQYLSPTATTPKATRLNSLKQPGGTDKTSVVFAGDAVLAGTEGDESAVAVSMDDGYSFYDVGLIDTTMSVIDDVAVNADGSKIYLTMHDESETSGNYDTSVWVKASSWKRIFSSIDIADAASVFLVRVAPDDDSAVYISSTGTTNMWVSKNSGMETWKAIPCYKVTAIQDFAVESADVVYALDTATGQGASKTVNAGASWGTTKEPTKTIDGYMITLAPNGDVLIGDTAGYVAFSKDGGSSFERTKDFGTGNAIVVADDGYADNNIIYVGVGTAIKRGAASTTTTPGTRGATTWPIVGMAQVEGATYALSANASQDSLLYMSLKLQTAGSTALAEWSSVTAAGETYLSTPQALKASLSGTSPKLWAIDTASPDLESYTDAIALVGPTLVSPADGVTVATNPGTGRSYDVTFIWQRYSDSDIDEMQIQIATDSAFDAVIYDYTVTGITTDTVAKVIGPTGQTNLVAEFMPGATYYWRVRTGLLGPMYSPWSETRSFVVGSIVAFAISGPEIGATDVGLTPTLTWAPLEGALAYEVMIAEDPTFGIVDISVTSENPFYKVGEALATSTTYYWRVRAQTGEAGVEGTKYQYLQAPPTSEWITGIFTTMAEPVAEEPTVITVTEPAPPAPAPEVKVVEVPGAAPIPSGVLWAIVVIGAVLVIALIILIVRTRRVA